MSLLKNENSETCLNKNFKTFRLDARNFPLGNLLFTSYDPQRPQVIVGPVIGTVTQTTARVLLEISCDATLTITAATNIEGEIEKICTTHSFIKDFPSTIVLSPLRPGVEYTIFVNLPTPNLIHASFRTRPSDNNSKSSYDILEHHPLNLGFVSGNVSFKRRDIERHVHAANSRHKSNELTHRELKEAKNYAENRFKCQRLSRELWKDIYKKICSKEIDALIHLGNIPLACGSAIATGVEEEGQKSDHELEKKFDTILDVFHMGLIAMESIATKEQAYSTICNLFRNVYRTAWNAPFVKHVLANVSNYMIMNEGEIGRYVYPHQGTENEAFVATCAYEVYNEYIRSLSHDYTPNTFNFATIPLSVHMTHSIGDDVALMLLDLKACKALRYYFTQNDKEDLSDTEHSILPHLGFIQWSDILDDLKPGGGLDTKKMLIVGIQERLSDPESSWYFTDHQPETYHFLRSLFEWRKRKPFGYRNILLIASDSIKQQSSSGVADIIIDTSKFYLDDPRLDRIRELSISGIGLLECLDDIPNYLRRSEIKPLPLTYKKKEYVDYVVTQFYEEFTDWATLLKSEGGIVNNSKSLKNIKLNPHKCSLVELGEEFLALRYQTANINCYATVVVEAKYMLPDNNQEKSVPNAKSKTFSNYMVRPVFKTQIIGANFDTQLSPPAAGIIRFKHVKDTDTRILKKEKVLCCCESEGYQICSCKSWVVR